MITTEVTLLHLLCNAERYMMTDRKRMTADKIVFIHFMTGIACAFIGFILYDLCPLVPSGHVIDAQFVTSLKWITLLMYFAVIFFMALVILPYIIMKFKQETRRNRIIIAVITFVTIGIVTVLTVPHLKAVPQLPTVEEHTIVSIEMHSKGRLGTTTTVTFEDGTYTHVSYYHYKRLSENSNAYVVYVENWPIGIFDASEYTLAD